MAGAVVFLLLMAALWPAALPDMEPRLSLRVTFPPAIPGQAEPLITTGITGDGDVLAVRYINEHTAVILYDAWGRGGPVSLPFELRPAVPRTLEIEMPALAPRSESSPDVRPLRVVLDGRELLNEAHHFHPREPQEISFATNHIGGTVAGTEFRGELRTIAGRRIRGGAGAAFSWTERLPYVFSGNGGRIGLYLLSGLAAGLGVGGLAAWCSRHPRTTWRAVVFAGRSQPAHGWFAATTLACSLIFTDLVTGGTYQLFVEESFGTFYDHQASSLLHGRLDVPEEALGGEAFIHEGKVYGYFGITPALLRLPAAATGVLFGQLSRFFMLVYFVACLAGAYALLCHAVRRLSRQPAWPSAWATGAFLGGGVLGTTLLFVGSRAYIYHEAILCGAALALWSSYFSLRYLEDASRRAWLGALVCGLFAVHARPPTGLYALCLLGAVALAHLLRQGRDHNIPGVRQQLLVGLAAVAAILSFNGLSYLKFDSFSGAPLHYNVQYTPSRLAKLEGKNFHLSNLHHNADTYFLQPDLELKRHFPFLSMGRLHRRSYPNARIDLAEPTLAVPYAMPFLFLLAATGVATGCLWAGPPLFMLTLGVAPMALALCAAIATSHRYTGDFCPFLIACSAWGMAAIDAAPRGRRLLLAVATVAAMLAVAITLALSLRFQGEMIWGATEETMQRYRHLARAVNEFFGLAPP